jgi:hypothetical protein
MPSIEAEKCCAIYAFALSFSDGDHHDGDRVLVYAIDEPIAYRSELDFEATRHAVKPSGFDMRMDQARGQALLELLLDCRIQAPPLFERGWQELEFIGLQV